MKTTLPKIFEEYQPSRIYDAEETVLFHRATVYGSLAFAKTQLIGSTKQRYVAVLCCANLPGDDKHPLLVIGKSKKP